MKTKNESEIIKDFIESVLNSEKKVIFGSAALGIYCKDLDIALSVDDYRKIIKNYMQDEMFVLEKNCFPIENYFRITPSEKSIMFKFRSTLPLLYNNIYFNDVDILILFDNDLRIVEKSIEILKKIPKEVIHNKKNRISIYEIFLKSYGWKEVPSNFTDFDEFNNIIEGIDPDEVFLPL